MRWWKLTMRLAIAAGILILGGIMIFFSQPIQRRIVARLVDPRPEDHFAIEHARVGFTRTEIRGFELKRPDIGYRVDYLDADLSVWDIYFNRHVKIGDIEARGVEFDFTRLGKVPRPKDPDPLQGLLGELDVPVMLSVGKGLMEGRVLLRGAGDKPLTISYRIAGGGLSPGEEGVFDLSALIEDPAAEGWLKELEADGKIVLRESEDGVLDRLTADAKVHVFGQEIPVDELIVQTTMQRTPDGEVYEGAVYHTGIDDQLSPLLEIDASFAHADRMFRGDWHAWAERGQIAGYLYVARLPEFSGEGTGEFSYDSDRKSLLVSGDFRAKTGELDSVAAEMQGLGGIAVVTRFEILRDREWLLLEKFRARISSSKSGEILVMVDSKNPLRYDRREMRITSTADRAELMDISVTKAPIEWAGFFRDDQSAQPLLLNGNISGHLLLSAFDGGLLVETLEPLRAYPVTAAARGKILLEDAGLQINGAFSWIDSHFGVRLDPMEFTVDDQMAIRIDGHFSQIEDEIDARISANLPVFLGEQFAGIHNLSSGLLDGAFSGNMAGAFRGGFILREAVAANTGEEIPPVYLDFWVEPTGKDNWRFEFPFRIDREGKPFAFTLSGETVIQEEQRVLDLNLRGEHIFLETLLDLRQAFAPSGEDEPIEEPVKQPFWNDWNARIEIAFDTIQFPGGYSLETIDASIETENPGMTFAGDAVFLGSQLSADAAIRFSKDQPAPYQLDGKIRANNVDLGALFRAAQPGRPPTLEGIYKINTQLRSGGKTLGQLLGDLRGVIDFTSDGGVLRLFYTENPFVNFGLSFAGLLGGIGGEFGTIVEIAEEFAFIPYDRVFVQIERNDELDILLRELQVLAPEFHLRGAGALEHVEGRDFSSQPMHMEFQLAARGQLEQLLARAGLLADERDRLGFRELHNPFSISGTIEEMEVNPLVSVIVGAVFELMVPTPGRAEEAREQAAPPRQN